jgi:DNA-binding transcriptional MocR family regulator
MTGRVFLAPGDTVVCGLCLPWRLGAFAASGARMTGIIEDDEGMPPDKLEERW